jgi:hypothetical protein
VKQRFLLRIGTRLDNEPYQIPVSGQSDNPSKWTTSEFPYFAGRKFPIRRLSDTDRREAPQKPCS